MKDLDPHKARRRWIIRLLIFIELICMSIGVMCVLFPPRWQVFTLILLGAREIMFKAHTKMKYSDKQEAEGIIDYGKREKAAKRGEKQKEQPRKKERGKQNGEVGVVGSYDNPNTQPKQKRKIETGAEKREERERKRGKAASSTKGTWE